MRIIKAGYRILGDVNAEDIYRKIEIAGRTCYKSDSELIAESGRKFVERIVRNHHEAMLEHAGMTVIFTVDRGVSHEIVRHRMASFAQESTRYCNYMKDKFGSEITVIEPCFFRDIPEETKDRIVKAFCTDGGDLGGVDDTSRIKAYIQWVAGCASCEQRYFEMLRLGMTPQEARSVLPNSLKTEIVVTANMREWRHILSLRAAGSTGKPHPQMAEVMMPLLREMTERMPELFDDIWVKEEEV